MIDFAIRRLRPGDSPDELTFLLHRAFAELAGQGIGCESAWARAHRFDRLAVDTPRGAHRQVAWYVDQGFGVLDFHGVAFQVQAPRATTSAACAT